MKQFFTTACVGLLLFSAGNMKAQRYLTEVFTDAEITITNDVVYGENISIENTVLQALAGINPPAAPDTASLLMDIYQPSQSVDTETERPLIVYLPTGNFLPPVVNGAATGTRKDSSAVNIAKLMAKRGYVCIVAEYRKGWNPVSPSQLVRTGTILNAAYKGQQDSKAAVRFMRANAATYKIATDKVALIGEGTGGYVAMAHAFLDQPWKISRLPGIGDNKFLRTENPDSSVVDTNRVGNFDGTNNIPLNLAAFAMTGDFTKVTGNVANNPNQDSDAQLVINLGGALGDTSWIDPGQIPMIGIHAVRDPNAPYQIGDVIVPTTGDIVIPFASGAGFNVQKADGYGNNASFANKIYPDPITAAVEARYNTSVSFVGSTMPVGSGKGLLPFILPENPTYPFNHGSPWQFWSSTSPQAMATSTTPNPGNPGSNFTIHELGSLSNPFMAQGDAVGRSAALTYIDTVMEYINPRIVCALGLPECDNFETIGFNEVVVEDLFVVYPNPSHDFVNIHVKAGVAALKTVRVFDMTGREVFAQTGLNQPKLQINREGLSSGVYFATVETTAGTSQVRFVFN
ncbi:MAG: T9SS type A sorting domain-containing protein [Bacteroidetes bacterium]|nr:T9SS type A sorting domain-containing protein [Bacteroidota bacterium]